MKALEETKKDQEKDTVVEEICEDANIEPEEVSTEPQTELEKAQMENQDMLNRLQRLQADFENFRKRSTKERVDLLNSANQSLVTNLLPVLDNFQRALDSQDTGKLKEGLGLILKQFQDILQKEGLKEIDSLNKPFDPNLHDAVMQVQLDDAPENTVVEVLQKGYLFRDKVIRPAMVKVNN